ncbi:ATP-dependent Clp protease adaptor ClpS [Alkalispirochaeta sphaeroplastigenens]|uniref:ATP-dependent Clp protease adapter protein ClpS n=1 Tax=Alkalispirochaeta sphaeroplastigenens TaxID=1187066 RepID=A0A2S4JUY8_9SPIO|nr:ATP-dependent Clp protease adaptor ClpS [Alkalispirochaeta sphaeroplastigenens]POR03303.1 ATP-dependent Clp protease adaptor ClpS [Alkalispirochaeta sphaeroplastigenens]
MGRTESPDRAVDRAIRELVQEPKRYRVILHNDNYTTMDFVVEVLRLVFHKSPVESHAIMMKIHKTGQGIVGVYSYDIAATRAARTRSLAKEGGYPLKCTIEEVS